jgi:hypothetical protein
MDYIQKLFLTLIELAAINTLTSDEFAAIPKQDTFLFVSSQWHDTERGLFYLSGLRYRRKIFYEMSRIKKTCKSNQRLCCPP